MFDPIVKMKIWDLEIDVMKEACLTKLIYLPRREDYGGRIWSEDCCTISGE